MEAYAIITREDPEPQPLDFNHYDNYDDWKTKEAEAAFIIRLSCSPEVRRIVKSIRNPHEMWNTLETSLDTAGSYIARQDILRQFCACRPKDDEPVEATSPSLVTTAYNWTILTMQSPIEISARKYSHNSHLSMRSY